MATSHVFERLSHHCPGAACAVIFPLSIAPAKRAEPTLPTGMKKAAKEKAQIVEQIVSSKKQRRRKKRGWTSGTPGRRWPTRRMQESGDDKWTRILKKASKTTRQRVE
uniref:Uncharacterized protein n=1 Tax=Malurus cyaneus samueli TaxID=2593467 RepID=A0A8C5T9Z3_9PASS